MTRASRPPSQTRRTFLENHVRQMASIDFFTVPNIRFPVLYVFLVPAHDRRRMLRFAVTDRPNPAWVARQLVDAFPCDTATRP